MKESESLYKETLNLPQTEFPMKANLAIREEELLKKWETLDIYNKILDNNKEKNNEKIKNGKEPLHFLLHDGPPYANGNIHIGHAVNKTLKDIIVKYYTLNEHEAPYIPGWDCHGLPIELQAAKKLSNKDASKNDVRDACREHALSYIKIQTDEFKRLLIMGDYKNSYHTLDYEYEADILGMLKIAHEKGAVYRGLRPVHWCFTCATALADAEIEYASHNSPSIYIGFNVVKGLSESKPVKALVWTTTPWTLPSNVALSFNKEFEYVIAYNKEKDENYIVAKGLMEKIQKDTSLTLEIVRALTIAEIENLTIMHPFINRESKVVFSDHVTLEAGTGIVHTAPGHGEDDYKVGLLYNLAFIMPIDARGLYTQEVPEYQGEHIFKVNPKIIERLKESGNLFYSTEINHSYPHCWRCKNPVITRTTSQWFISMTHNNLIKNATNELGEVEFIPANRKERMLGLLETRPDWCISRQRVWGVPLTALHCNSCGGDFLDPNVMQKSMEKAKQEGFNFWFNENETVESLFGSDVKCLHCEATSKNLTKSLDILDVWFDSGVSWYAVLKRFTNGDYQANPSSVPVADVYLEGADQYRSWFQASLLTSTLARNKAPYKKVVGHGMALDEKGKAMSKSIGNTIAPLEVIKTYGADILRLWIVSQDYTEDMRVGDSVLKQMADAYRKIRNTFRFMLSNLYDYTKDVHTSLEKIELKEVDAWALNSLYALEKEVEEHYKKFEFIEVFKKCYHFMNLELSSFYLDMLKDTLYTYGKNSPIRRSSQKAFMVIIQTLARLLAPILSFTSEEIYTFLPQVSGVKESIFLTDKVDLSIFNTTEFKKSYEKIEKIKSIREEVLKALEMARQTKKIGANLEAMIMLTTADKELYDFLTEQQGDLPRYFIVSSVMLDLRNRSSFKEFAMLESTTNQGLKIWVYPAEGEKCPRCWKRVEALTPKGICNPCDEVLAEL